MITAAVEAATASAQDWWEAPAVVAGLIAAFAAVFTLWVNGRRARVERQRVLFADAFGAIVEYREYPYIVRRRSADGPAEERARINRALSDVQHRLNRYEALLKVENKDVGKAYSALLKETRAVAGGEIRRGWEQQPASDDSSMSIADVDLTPLGQHDDAYLTAVRKHLRLVPSWLP